MTDDTTFSVLIAGGGVAALEAALTLRDLAEERVKVDLLAPEPSFWYRPVAVAEPFGQGTVRHFDLGRVAEAAGAGFVLDALARVDGERRQAHTATGAVLPFDALLIACGAVPTPAVPGALTFRGPADTAAISSLLDEIERGDVQALTFAVPWGATWSLPAYELALMTAAWLAARDVRDVALTLVTPEDEPLQVFGRAASELLRDLLAESGIALVTSTYPAEAREGMLRVMPGGSLAADRVVALPRLRGQRIDGVPQTVDGFVPVDGHCCVVGMEAVFAAGDITSFPIKQGGIASQQAVAAAEAIGVWAGTGLIPTPFRPVLRGLLLTGSGSGPRYLRRDLAASGEPWASYAPLWWPPTKIVGRRLAPFLATLAGEEAPPTALPAASTHLEVEVEVVPEAIPQLSPARLEREDDDPHGHRPTVAVEEVMNRTPLLVEAGEKLAEAAGRLRVMDASAMLVVETGRLVGILTARDLLRALAGGVAAGGARVREWMTADPVTVSPETTTYAAATLMAEYRIHHLPVVDEGRPAGLVEIDDVTRSTLASWRPAIGLGF